MLVSVLAWYSTRRKIVLASLKLTSKFEVLGFKRGCGAHPSIWVNNVDTNLSINRQQGLLANNLPTCDEIKVSSKGSSLMKRRGTYSGKNPLHLATYSLCTPPSAARCPPNQAPSFFDPSAVREHTITPEVSLSSRFEAGKVLLEQYGVV